MINIIDLIDERKSKQRYQSDKQKAVEIFYKQKESISSIKHTEGYKQIRSYWLRELEAAQTRLMTCRTDDILGVQAEMRQAIQFIEFLDNLAN